MIYSMEGIYAMLQDINSLSFVEVYWESMLNNYSEFTIISIFTFILHEVAYFGAWIPYLAMDFIPYFSKYKIQGAKPNSWPATWKCLKRILFNHTVIQFPMILMSEQGLKYLGFSVALPLPTLTTIMWKCAVMFVIEDCYFYFIHRFLHWKKIYKYIHKVHHDHSSPFGITAEYAHPLETMFLGVGTILGPLLLTRHLLTLWVWLTVRVVETVDDHSGYDLPFPWSICSHIIPFWGGPVHHDYHHRFFEGNYASVFTFWDRLFGTDAAFRKFQLDQRRQGKSTWSDVFDKLQGTKEYSFKLKKTE